MDNKPSIFICYKKLLVRQEGEREIERESTEAPILQMLLSQGGYDAWIDEAVLMAGMEWEEEIYAQLLVSDVLLVLIGAGTSESEWVRREIALANALKITIVPLGFKLSREQMNEETRSLDIHDRQWTITQNIAVKSGPALMEELRATLDQAAARTREAQKDVLEQFRRRSLPARPKAEDRQRAASFDLDADPHHVALHVASGDLSTLQRIDVMVNSENDWMQMARFFESRTVSAILRRRGAEMSGGRYLDTIQQELDLQLDLRGRPVQPMEVFATSSGGPQSLLSTENETRAILHVAAVQAVAAENRVVPCREPYQIEGCVRSALAKMAELNAADGVFSPEGGAARAEQERRAAAGDGKLRHILFPLFGTGEGGLLAAEVVGPMLDGMMRFLTHPNNALLAETLSDVYVSAYAQPDVDAVTAALDERLVRVS